MTVNVNTGFDDQDYLRDIRKVVLNPLAVKAASTEKKVEDIQVAIKPMFQGATAHVDTKVIAFHQHNGNDAVVDLDGMFREGSDLSIQGGTGPAVDNVTAIKYVDSKVRRVNGAPTEVSYDWKTLVPTNQRKLKVGKVGGGLGFDSEAVFFKGGGVEVETGAMDITTVTFPEPIKPMLASIPAGGITKPTEITAIELDGEVSGSIIKDGKLTINLSASGGGTADENFKGFFETLGDIESKVANPVNNKSYAFAKDSKLGGSYYTPYFYVNNAWTELTQDPALLYSATTAPNPQGVFSIKPNPAITIDATGQLNLDGLSTPSTPQYFHGFFKDVNDIKANVPNPTLDRSFAYAAHPSGTGLIGYRYALHGQTAKQWKITAPIGGFSLVDKSVGPTRSDPVFGICNDDKWSLSQNGLLSLKPIDTTTEIIIADHQGATTGGKVNTIKFQDGKPFAEITGSTLTLNHPQRVINYNATWEQEHSGEDYRGNLYFDATSDTWMGWADPTAGGAVDVKWTRLLHRNMSDEVRDLVKRVPAKAPSVTPGGLGDNRSWDYNGVTYLDSTDSNLPEDLKNICGGYITTSVQDSDLPGVTIPQSRIQSCAADRKEGGTWVRRFMSTGSPGAQTEWSPWVRTSFSHKDIENHMEDPGAHSKFIRFYKITSFGAQYSTFYNQQEGSAAGGVRAGNCSLLADNYGAILADQDYMQPAYEGKYRVKGSLALAGYKGADITTGSWNVTVRTKHKDTSTWQTIGHFRYEHTSKKDKYPIMTFETDANDLLKDDQVIINVTFTDNKLITDHPGLYFVPIRSYFLLEDENTRAGTNIASTFSKFLGNMDVAGEVGVRVHHADLNNTGSTIRVYGEKLSHIPREMNKI